MKYALLALVGLLAMTASAHAYKQEDLDRPIPELRVDALIALAIRIVRSILDERLSIVLLALEKAV